MIDELELCHLWKKYRPSEELNLSYLKGFEHVHFILCINPAFPLGDFDLCQKGTNIAVPKKNQKNITIQVDLQENQHFQKFEQGFRNSKRILDFIKYLQERKADRTYGYSNYSDSFNEGEFVKKNNVKRQQEYANLILFQVKFKDGN